MIDTVGSGEPFVRCQIRFHATAAGQTGAAARLREGIFYWYLPTDTVTPIGATPVSIGELTNAFGTSRVLVGTPAMAEWEIQAAVPVRGRFHLGYGNAAAADASFTCGPPALPFEGEPPQVERVVLSPAGELEPGDTLRVEVTISSPSGLWLATVEVSGATYVKRNAWGRQGTMLTRTFSFVIGPEAELDMPLTVVVNAVDVLGQHAFPVVESGGPVVDRTPPVLHAAGTLHGGSVRPLEGQFAPRDRIILNLAATDNHRLGHVVYEFGGNRRHRDSIAAGESIHQVPIQVPVDAVGAERITVLVRDVSGNASAPRTSQPGSFRIYPEVTTHHQTLTLPFHVSAATLHPGGELLAVLGKEKSELFLVDVNTMALIRTIPLTDVPTGFDFSPGGDSVIIAMPTQYAILVVDLTHSPAIISSIPITVAPSPSHRPEDVRMLADGHLVAAINHSNMRQHALAILDLNTSSQRLISPSQTTYPSYHLIGSTSRQNLVVYDSDSGCLFPYDPVERGFGRCRSAPFPYGASFLSHDGGTLLHGEQVYSRELEPLRSLWRLQRTSTEAGAVSKGGEYVYLWNGRGIAKVRSADGTYLERYPFYAPPPHVSGMLSTPDGRFLITTFLNQAEALIIRTTLP